MARERDRGQSDQANGDSATPVQGRAAAPAADVAPDPASVHANDARPPRDKLRVEPPSLSLPKGGGALKSIDETYSTSPSTGTSSLAIPLPLTADRTGAAPAIGLRYDSGIGNSVVGLGWSLDLPSIRRRTDHQLPRYRGDDVYLLHGAEELVVVSTWDGTAWHDARGPVGAYTVTRYRPRIEAAFARIERIDHAALGSWWRVTSRDNVTTFYGLDDASRIFDPANPAHVFQWLPVLSFDDKGNCTVYEYKPEDLVSVPPSRADANRRSGLAAYTNRHLKRVHYGNRTPYAVDPEDPYRPTVPATDPPRTFLFHAVIDYGEHDPLAPELAEAPGRSWLARPDPFSTYRSGFDVRTSRLVQRILMFHEFDELDGGVPSLVRSLDLAYASSGAASPQATEVSYLASITQCGYARGADGSYGRRTLPPLELAYQPLAWNTEIQTVDRASLANLPAGATTGYDWLDLDGEGIAGLFTEQANGWFYKANLGDTDEDGRVQLDAARLVVPRPSFLGMATGSLHLADLDANGLQQIVVHTPQLQGYFDRDIHGEFLPFRPFPSMVRIDLDDKNLRMLDLDGDGRADLLISEEDALVWYHGDKRGYQPRERVPRSHDQERGPAIVFAEELQTIFLADMTGDGLVDIVRIRNRDICYWPNLGYGRFGARVAMDHAPQLAPPDQFDARYLHLADVSGTGATDLLYLSPRGCTAYLNLSGNAWSDPQPIAPFFPVEQPNQIAVTDLLGNGTACVVWSSSMPAHAAAPMRYLDLMGGKKPHLMTGYVNNLGKEVSISYKSSTFYYLTDKLAGRPWVTKLAFPVHCVRQVETHDRTSGSRLVTQYRYHHGYFDRSERELRGFGMVEQLDIESFEHWVAAAEGVASDHALDQPPILTRTWFHTGAPDDRAEILTRFRDEYWDREMARAGFPVAISEPALPDARLVVGPLVDPSVIAPIAPDTWREVLRACKGLVLRSEVFALDAPASGATAAELQRQLSPYSVSTHNCVVEILQPVLGAGAAARHAAFVVKESEVLSWQYERALADPRVDHKLNLAIDEYGNVTESATVSYARAVVDPTLPPKVRDQQAKTSIVYVATELTNDAIDATRYRLRLVSRVRSYEISQLHAAGARYAVADFAGAAALPAPGTPGASAVKQLLRSKQTLYYDATATAAAPLGTLDARALVYEQYELAYTPELLATVLGGRATDAMMAEGGYVHRDNTSWWIPSGRWEYVTGAEDASAAASRFFAQVAFVDPFGIAMTIGYFAGYALMRNRLTDAVGNVTQVDAFDLRALQPVRVIDPNLNVTEVLLDELGLVIATAVRGKGGEADDLTGLSTMASAADAAARTAFLTAPSSVELDAAARLLLRRASTRIVYDLDRYRASGGREPPVAATIRREQHAVAAADAPLQLRFEYSNGRGTIELTKVQAEPGIARQVVFTGDTSYTITSVDTSAELPPRLRWVGNGRTVVNNKGNPVKEYEPFFSVTHEFESEQEMVESGVTILSTYDPLGRVVRVDYPDDTFATMQLDRWSTTISDRNDTVLDSRWYHDRVARLIDAELIAAGKDPVHEAQAAQQTAAHANTPLVRVTDPLGRAILDLDHAGFDAANLPILYATVRVRDVIGAVLEVDDARDNQPAAYAFDLAGRIARHTTMDAGTRWLLDGVSDAPVRSWDERGHTFVFGYDDPLHRPTSKRVVGGDGPVPLDHVFELRIYGEGRAGDTAHNLRGHVALLYDTAGRVENQQYDFQGNLLASARRFCTDPKAVVSWGGADPDTALLPETFSSSAAYDALDRVASRTTADGSVYVPSYNAANLLEQIRVTQPGAASDTCVANIDYDAKGQRVRIDLGNGVSTLYTYDVETFRILSLTSRGGNGALLQDLHYTYDPIGNATHVEDHAVPTVWFANQQVTGLATYQYDPLYQLIGASGREHIAQVEFGTVDNWNDLAAMTQVATGDTLAWRTYTQQYTYDPAGNLASLSHVTSGGSWTRGYTYAGDSNRLLSTQVGSTTFPYGYQPKHGFMTSMPHLTVMQATFRDELQAVARQAVTSGTPETTYYVYDGNGKRARKLTERAAAAGATPGVAYERFYLDGVDIYREYGATGTTLERTTLDVNDDRQCIVHYESETIGDAAGTRLVRYMGVDHLQSSRVETDALGRVISYEEYHPFGTTAYQAMDKTIAAAAKRYRFTGMERDDESGLEYHTARYYIPWLGRWIAPDTHPDRLDGNRYAYVRNNPIKYRDSNGAYEEPVHGVLTYRLAIAAGIPEADAARLAIATGGVDHSPKYHPMSPEEAATYRHSGITRDEHFAPPEVALQRVRADIAAGGEPNSAENIDRFALHLHTLEDVGFVDAPGPHMRNKDRILSPTIGLLASYSLLIGGALAKGAAAITQNTGWWLALKVTLIILSIVFLAFGAYAMPLAFITDGIGHPQYRTQRGYQSNSFTHYADQAWQDPDANTKELRRVKDQIFEYARTHYHPAHQDDAAAEAAISDVVHADNSCLISAFANTVPAGAQRSYVQHLGDARPLDLTDTYGGAGMDVSFPSDVDAHDEKFHYTNVTNRSTCAASLNR